MYLLRGLVVSGALFALVYACVSATIAFSARILVSWARHFLPARSAALLFALRIAPLLMAIAITTVFAIPSFLRFEPRTTDESIGYPAIVLSVLGITVIAAGITRAWLACGRSARQVAEWVKSSESSTSYLGVPAFSTANDAPLLAVAGLRSPKLLISTGAAAQFSEQEMRAAIAHELAHVRRRDNFSKMFLRLCFFPGMKPLERGWLAAVEMAADDASVSSEREALDLASALIKVSRLAPAVRTPELAMSLVPEASGLAQRVQRLLAWKTPSRSPSKRARFTAVFAGVFALAVLAIMHSPALAGMHAITEALIR
jgi:beta-lactamase regulating signal transducer with metallopeptidase domain